MADFRLGRLKFKWRGEWSASTAYVIDDIVKYGANSYVCVVNHTSAAAETSFYSSDLSNWELHTEGLRHRGDWQGGDDGLGNSINTWYAVNDIVKYGNSQYRCIVAHTSSATIDFTKWSAYAEGLKFEDTWSASEYYEAGDVVTFGGYSYVSLRNNTNIQPNTDGTAWDVISTGYLSQGEYVYGTVYVPGNVVKYGGNTYSCKVTTNDDSLNVGTITGDGSTVTITFQNARTVAPFGIGDFITVSGVSVGGYNGQYRVQTCSSTQVTYANATTTAGAAGGSIAYTPVPTNTRYWDLVVEGFNGNVSGAPQLFINSVML